MMEKLLDEVEKGNKFAILIWVIFCFMFGLVIPFSVMYLLFYRLAVR